MYEKEIENLTYGRCLQEIGRETINTAIALMRAAEPKDEAVEREHCKAAAAAIVRHLDYDPDVEYTWTSELAAQRAAVRAECAEESRLLREAAGDYLRERLTLQAEIGRLRLKLIYNGTGF